MKTSFEGIYVHQYHVNQPRFCFCAFEKLYEPFFTIRLCYRIKIFSYFVGVAKAIFSWGLRDFQYPFVLRDILSSFIRPRDACELQVQSEEEIDRRIVEKLIERRKR